jgi:hypothetical protein
MRIVGFKNSELWLFIYLKEHIAKKEGWVSSF